MNGIRCDELFLSFFDFAEGGGSRGFGTLDGTELLGLEGGLGHCGDDGGQNNLTAAAGLDFLR